MKDLSPRPGTAMTATSFDSASRPSTSASVGARPATGSAEEHRAATVVQAQARGKSARPGTLARSKTDGNLLKTTQLQSQQPSKRTANLMDLPPIGATAWDYADAGPPPAMYSANLSNLELDALPPLDEASDEGFFLRAKAELLRVDVTMQDVDRYLTYFDRFHGVSSENLVAYIKTGAFKTLDSGEPKDLDDVQRCLPMPLPALYPLPCSVTRVPTRVLSPESPIWRLPLSAARPPSMH